MGCGRHVATHPRRQFGHGPAWLASDRRSARGPRKLVTWRGEGSACDG
jgi:hypothetical protein